MSSVTTGDIPLREKSLEIRVLEPDDPSRLVQAFAGTPWERSGELYTRYVEEQEDGSRLVLVAFMDDSPVGFGSLLWTSSHPPFHEAGIPEIHDLVVHPDRRTAGVATALMGELERRAAEVSGTVGLGVGLHRGFGAAQRLYVKRGYVPDGQGVFHDHRPVAEGRTVPLDDDLTIWLLKDLS